MMRCDFTTDEEFYQTFDHYNELEEQEYYEMEYWLSLANEEEQKQGNTNE